MLVSKRKSKWQSDRGLIIALFFIRMFKTITPEAHSLQLLPLFLSASLSFFSLTFILWRIPSAGLWIQHVYTLFLYLELKLADLSCIPTLCVKQNNIKCAGEEQQKWALVLWFNRLELFIVWLDYFHHSKKIYRISRAKVSHGSVIES